MVNLNQVTIDESRRLHVVLISWIHMPLRMIHILSVAAAVPLLAPLNPCCHLSALTLTLWVTCLASAAFCLFSINASDFRYSCAKRYNVLIDTWELRVSFASCHISECFNPYASAALIYCWELCFWSSTALCPLISPLITHNLLSWLRLAGAALLPPLLLP